MRNNYSTFTSGPRKDEHGESQTLLVLRTLEDSSQKPYTRTYNSHVVLVDHQTICVVKISSGCLDELA